MKIEDLEVTLKTFNKDDLLIIFVPSTCTQDMVCELQEEIITLKIENKILILPDFFAVLKVNFIESEGKKVSEIDIRDDVVNVKFVDIKNSKNEAPFS